MTTSSKSTALSSDEVRALLGLAQVRPSPLSVLGDLMPSDYAGREILASLRQKEMTDAAGRPSSSGRGLIETLAAPSAQLLLAFGEMGDTRTAVFARGAAGLIRCAQDNDAYVVESGTTAADLERMCGWWLHADQVADRDASVVDVSAAEVAAVAGVVDALREEELRAFIERRAVEPGVLTEGDIDQQIARGRDIRDVRWLSGLLAAYAPERFMNPDGQLSTAMAQLTRHGWTRSVQGGMTLTQEGARLADGLLRTTPHVVLRAQAGAGRQRTVILVRTVDAFRSFDFSSDDRARIGHGGPPLMRALVTGTLAVLGH